MLSGMVFVELVETPQRDWWVVADGRVVGLYLKTDECPEPYRAAAAHGKELSETGGMLSLHIGTTWRSMAFDHLEDLSCLRSTCCRFIPRGDGYDPEEDEVEDAA